MSGAAESWLRSEDHDKFAAAAVLCENSSGFCMQDGYCHFDGQCFRRGRAAVVAACRAIERAAADQPDDIAGEMRTAATLLKRTLQDDESGAA
jgi:hypothetical protein